MLPVSRIKRSPLSIIVAFAAVLVLSACSGSGSDDMEMGGDTAGDTTAGDTTAGDTTAGETTGGDTAPFDATFAAIQTNVFDISCIACHAGAEPPAQLSLESDLSYSSLVGVSSTEVPAVLRVAAGDPDNSYLIQKMEGTAAVGSQMPLGGVPLSTEVIAVVRAWISAGAAQ